MSAVDDAKAIVLRFNELKAERDKLVRELEFFRGVVQGHLEGQFALNAWARATILAAAANYPGRLGAGDREAWVLAAVAHAAGIDYDQLCELAQLRRAQ